MVTRIAENSAAVEAINEGHIKFGKAFTRLGKENQIEVRELDQATVELIHDESVHVYGGSFGIRDEGLLESVCVAPYQDVFGQELYPTVFDKAAKYLFDFANYQVFVDGNKRTGLHVAHVFMELNGFSLDLTPSEAYALVMDIANGNIRESAEVSEYIKSHSSMKGTAPLLEDPRDRDEMAM